MTTRLVDAGIHRPIAAALLAFAALTATPGTAGAQGAPAVQGPASIPGASSQAAPTQGPGQAAGPPTAGTSGPGAAAARPPVSDEIQALRGRLDAVKLDLDQREAALGRRDLASTDLARLREGIDALADRIRGVVDGLSPRLEAAKARLDQLGPKPKEGAEGADVARERGEREAAFAEVDETQRLARALLVQADQITDQIANRRRTAFTRALFERGDGLASPSLWARTTRDLPRDLAAAETVIGDTMSRVGANASAASLGFLGLAIGIAVALYFGRHNIAPRLGARARGAVAPPRARRLMGAWRILIIGAVPAALGAFAVRVALDASDLLPGRVEPVLNAILLGLAFVAFVEALTDALMAPGKSAWRLVPLEDAGAARAARLAVAIAALVTAGKVVETFNAAIAAALPVSIATRGVFALVAAVLLGEGLRRFAATAESEEACLGPYVPSEAEGGGGGPLRTLGWTGVVAVIAAALVGYVALASFLVDQFIWLAILAGVVALLVWSADAFLGEGLRGDTRIATALQANTGLRRRSLQQIAVLSTGLARVVVFLLAALLALAPWGVDSSDLVSSVRAAFFGFKVGDVTISISTIAVALLLFAIGFVITRAVQRWLENTLLPATELDAGLRNSISTATGYFGILVALAVAFSYLGLSLDKIAIVAGALSVGIGFGLQSIVNNFVSGLILLWERPIRVGDLVVVGDSEGYVRRISVRATEIQTFDRSTTIVPNSNLISGVVKNRVRGDRTGRVTLTVNVLRSNDPVRAAEIIAGTARAHVDVVEDPAPRVVFRKIGDTFLEFELIAVVTDVNQQVAVQNDLNHAVFRALTADGFIPPLGPGASIVTVHGLEPVQSALGLIANAIGPEAARPARGSEPDLAGTDGAGTDGAGTDGPEARGEAAEEGRPVRRRLAGAES